MYKHISTIALLSLFSFIFFAHSAYAGVVLYTSDSIIALSGGINITVKSGSSADSVSVAGGSFTVTVTGADKFTVESLERRSFSTSVSGYSTECLASLSRLAISPGTGTVSVTVTPSSSVDSCTIAASGAGGGWGGPVAGTVVAPVPSSAKTIYPGSGGYMTHLNADASSVTVAVPAGALFQDTVFSIAALSFGYTAPPVGMSVLGDKAYEITALSNGKNVTQFAKPITVTFYFVSDFSAAVLKIYSLNALTNTWEAISNSAVSADGRTVTAPLNHLTKFAVFSSGTGFLPAISSPVPLSAGVMLMRAHGDARVYAVENGKKRWIQSPEAFIAAGYDWSKIVQVNAAELGAYTDADGSLGKIVILNELHMGMKNDQVKLLQIFLARDPLLYPEGKITGYFGPLTKAAVKRFQAKHGIAMVGRVGPRTLAKLNELMQ